MTATACTEAPSTPVNQSHPLDRTLLKTFFNKTRVIWRSGADNWKGSHCGSRWSEMYWQKTSVVFMSQKSTNKLHSASRNLVLSIGGKKNKILIKSVKRSRWMLRVQPLSLRVKQHWLAGLRLKSQGFKDCEDKMSRQLTMKPQGHITPKLHDLFKQTCCLTACLLFFIYLFILLLKGGLIYNESPWFSRQS